MDHWCHNGSFYHWKGERWCGWNFKGSLETSLTKHDEDECWCKFSETDHTAATRAGVRGHDGPLVRAQALWVENVPNALTNEALAVRDGVRLACDMRLQNVIIGTDVKGVADLWKKRDEGRSEIAYILMDIEGMSEGFHSFFLDHVGREANQLAHLCDGRASHTRRR